MAKQYYYFTYGFGQLYANCFTKILATSKEDARRKMMEKTKIWAFQYDTADKAGVKQFNLREIPLSDADKNKLL